MSLDLGYRLAIVLLGVLFLPITITLVWLWCMAWVFMRFIVKDKMDLSLKRFIYEFYTEAF